MLSLILVLLLVWFVLVVFLAAWTLWFQAYIYTQPVEQLLWRAPAAGTLVALSVFLWAFLDYRAPGRYTTLWQFDAADDFEYPQLIVPAAGGKDDVYKKVNRGDKRLHYERNGRPLMTRPDKVITVEENGEKSVFEPDRDERGKFKATDNEGLRYRDAKGRIMEDGQLGRVRTFYPGRLFLNLFLNFFHLVVWFLSLWLLLRFQWSHALGLAVVLWGVMLLFIVPQVLAVAEKTAVQRALPAAK